MVHWSGSHDVDTNREFLRTVNTRLLAARMRGWVRGNDARFFCECGSHSCTGRIPLSEREFERLLHFRNGRVVAPGHARPRERVLLVTERYVVVATWESAD